MLGKAFEGVIPLPPFAGEAIDIANGYLYLASDEAKFVTGESSSLMAAGARSNSFLAL